jgi:hypothetical protein
MAIAATMRAMMTTGVLVTRLIAYRIHLRRFAVNLQAGGRALRRGID